MRNTLTVCALVLCTLILSTPRSASAQGQVVEVGMRFWKVTPELVLADDGLTTLGLDAVDFVQEFGLESKSFRGFKASIGRSHKFRISRSSFDYDEEATIQRSIVFLGQTFPINTSAEASVEWDFVSRPGGFLGLVTDLRYNKVNASIDSPALTSVAATDVTAPIPTIGLIGRGYLGSHGSITAEFSGLKLSRNNEDTQFEGSAYDFDIYGTIHLGRQLGVEVGYRSLDIHYLVDGDSGDLKMKGPYIGGTLRF